MLTALLFCLLPTQDNAKAESPETWQYPLAVASRDGKVVVVDRTLPGLWEVTEGELSLLFQASKKFKTPLNAPRCVAIGPDGTVYAGCSSTRQVYRMDGDKPVPLAGVVGEDGNVGVGVPMDIAVTDDGLYVSDLELHRIVRIPLEGGPPEDVADVRAPRGLFWDGERLLIVSHGSDALLSMDSAGGWEPLVQGMPFEFAHDVASLDGQLYVTDGYADGVWPVAEDGTVGEKLTADGMENPVGISVDGDRLLIADPRTPDLYSLTPDGAIKPLGIGG